MRREHGVHADFICKVDAPDGHTIIQVDKNAQNSILLFGGTNQMLTREFVDEILSRFHTGDMLLLQNEVNLLPYIVDQAYAKGMQITLNPSPYNEKLAEVDMGKVSIFLLNEVEGFQLTEEKDPEQILSKMRTCYPYAKIVLTLGKDGAIYADTHQKHYQPIFKVTAVDTTAAGDTFTGYFLAGITEGLPIPQVLRMSAKAASIAVTRQGTVPSIPCRAEVEQALSIL